jgi:hypothetical protein
VDEKRIQGDIMNVLDKLNVIIDQKKKPKLEVIDYPVNCVPHNPMLDIRQKIPLFTKSEKSRSLYAAGYYLIQSEGKYLQAFCPKLTLLKNTKYIGPFKTKAECKQKLKES